MGWHRELPVPRDRSESQTELHVGRRRFHRYRRDIHSHAHRVRHTSVTRAVGLQGGPEAELRRGSLWLANDGRKTRRPSREDLMNWNHWIRQTHRWLSIAFTVTVMAKDRKSTRLNSSH